MTQCSQLGKPVLTKMPLQHLHPMPIHVSVSGLPVGTEVQHRSLQSPLEKTSAWQLRTLA